MGGLLGRCGLEDGPRGEGRVRRSARPGEGGRRHARRVAHVDERCCERAGQLLRPVGRTARAGSRGGERRVELGVRHPPRHDRRRRGDTRSAAARDIRRVFAREEASGKREPRAGPVSVPAGQARVAPHHGRLGLLREGRHRAPPLRRRDRVRLVGHRPPLRQLQEGRGLPHHVLRSSVWTLLDPLPQHLLAQRREPLHGRTLLQLHARGAWRPARHQHALAARRCGGRGRGALPRAGRDAARHLCQRSRAQTSEAARRRIPRFARSHQGQLALCGRRVEGRQVRQGVAQEPQL